MRAPTTVRPGESARSPLTRHRVLQAALAYVDTHGLATLSMHKLGTELGVKGMSLYSHVDSKDALLDGVVEAIWSEIDPPPAGPDGDWQTTLRGAGTSIRAVVRRHPHAAPLLAGRAVMPTAALAVIDSYRKRLVDDGFAEPRAVEALRVVTVYALGYALTEIAWEASGAAPCHGDEDELARLRRVTAMVPPEAPDNLIRLAMSFCGGFDPDVDFDRGLDLMLAGLAAQRDIAGKRRRRR